LATFVFKNCPKKTIAQKGKNWPNLAPLLFELYIAWFAEAIAMKFRYYVVLSKSGISDKKMLKCKM
jgi:hypothetical protein